MAEAMTTDDRAAEAAWAERVIARWSPDSTDVERFVDEVEVRARHLTGREHYGCIPAWAWRGAIAERFRDRVAILTSRKP